MIGLWGPQNLMSKSNSAIDADFAGIFFKPIAEYLNNPDTAEIMVNAHDDIWVEDSNGLYKIPETFSQDALVSAVNSLAQYVGRPIIENVFAIDARMPDGSRVCIVLPPVSGEDPVFAIRKFKAVVSDLEFLVKRKTLTSEMVEFIEACVHLKKNMMVAGGTSSGKTTLLNLIAAKIPDHDRIVTIEDSRELQLKQDHVLSLEAKPADKYGKGEFSIRQCLKSTLRLRPDRIVVGEIRAGEAFDLIQAMNTGHGGCMGTVHANTPTDTLRRMESLSLMADIDMPLVALRSMIASALDLIICPARLSDGSRRIVQIAEIGPLTEKGDYQTYDIIRYVSARLNKNTRKIEGYFEFTGHIPSFYDMFEAEGLYVPIEFFRKRVMGEVPEDMVPSLREKGFEIDAKIIKPNGEIVALDKPLPPLSQNPAPIQAVPAHQEVIPPEKETLIQTNTPAPEVHQTIEPEPKEEIKFQPPVFLPIQAAQTQAPINTEQSNLITQANIPQANFIAGQYEQEPQFEETAQTEINPTEINSTEKTTFEEPEYLNQPNIYAESEISENLTQNNLHKDEYEKPSLQDINHNFEDLAQVNLQDSGPPFEPEKDEYQTNTNFDDDELPKANNYFEEPIQKEELPNEIIQDNSNQESRFIKTAFQSDNSQFSPPIQNIQVPTEKTNNARPSILERLSRISENYNAAPEPIPANPEINNLNNYIPETTFPPAQFQPAEPSQDFYNQPSHQVEAPITQTPVNDYQFEDTETEDFNLNSVQTQIEPEKPIIATEQPMIPENNIPINNYSAQNENPPETANQKEAEPSGNSQNAVIADILRRMRESRAN